MATDMPVPDKTEIAQRMRDTLTTLTPEAQNAGLKKAEELGFKLDRGQIPLSETLINLDQARAMLLGLIDKDRLRHLPLKIQHILF